MFPLKITKSAKKDLTDILKYTIQEHGENQWKKYGEIIEKTLILISNNPNIDHKRNGIPEYCFAWPI